MTEDPFSVDTLSEKFDKALNIHFDIQKSNETSGSPSFQGQIQKTISLLEEATHMVNNLNLFSRNEEFEEISTADLKYLLLPALLGNLTSKLMSRDRLQLIETSQVYYRDYLSRLKDYGVFHGSLPKSEEESGEAEASGELVVASQNNSLDSLEAMARKRKAKIERYSQQKELEGTQRILKDRIQNGSVDDETLREYYSVLLRFWINSALEDLESINMEKPILKHMAQMKSEGKVFKKEAQKQKPIQPVIIARNELQKKVLGVGYPSIPVLTVNEFYDQRYGDQAKGSSTHPGLSLQKMAEDPEQTAREIEAEDAEKEENVEKDDHVTLIRERNWDEWKDDHRRGWGNRHNMG